jgi:hypothetical protein
MFFGMAPVVRQRVITVKSARSWERPDFDPAIEKTLLPGVANKLSTAFPDAQESNAVSRRKGPMELSSPQLSGERPTENTVISVERLRRLRTSPTESIGSLPRPRRRSR